MRLALNSMFQLLRSSIALPATCNVGPATVSLSILRFRLQTAKFRLLITLHVRYALHCGDKSVAVLL